MAKNLVSQIKEAAKEGVQRAKPVTTFVGMASTAVQSFIENNYALQIAQLLPKENKEEVSRIISQATLVICANAQIKACTPQTIIGSMMSAAMLGLNPFPSLNEVFFIPYGNSCTLQIGYKGWYKLLSNTGLLEYMIAEPVHKNELFKCIRGSKAEIIHEQGFEMVTEENIVGAYAIIKLKGMGEFSKFLCKEEIEHLRKKGQSGKSWKTDYAPMAVVKAIKKLIHTYLPTSDSLKSLQKAAEYDSAIIDIANANMANKELIPVPTEEAENVEVENVVEVQEVVQINPQNIGSDTVFYKWFEWAKQNPLITFDEETEKEIARRILIGEVSVSDVPNQWLEKKEIENAVLTVEQNGLKV